MITKLALWWLTRQGCYVVRPGFLGLVLGHCVAKREGSNVSVVLPFGGAKIVALNNSHYSDKGNNHAAE